MESVFFIIGLIIIFGLLFLMMKTLKMLPDSTILFILAVVIGSAFWGGGSYILIKSLVKLDEFFEAKASLDKDIRDIHQELIIFTSMSIIFLLVAVYFFQDWLEEFNDVINRTTEDYFTIIVPLFFLFGAISLFRQGLKKYKNHKGTIKRRDDKFNKEKIYQIIRDYGKYLEENSGGGIEIIDVSVLPHPKEDILTALQIGIALTNDEKVLNNLKISAISLSDFQENVGPEPIIALGVSPLDFDKYTQEELAAKIAESDWDKYQSFKEISDKDLELNILPRIRIAEDMRNQRNERRED